MASKHRAEAYKQEQARDEILPRIYKALSYAATKEEFLAILDRGYNLLERIGYSHNEAVELVKNYEES